MKTEQMQAWQLTHFGVENLRLEDIEKPAPEEHQVLIRVSAASLNFRDYALITGHYAPDALDKGPIIPVSDAVGEVVAIGEKVARFKIGDRIATHFHSHWITGKRKPNEGDYTYGFPLPGALAQYMLLEEEGAVPVPEYLTDGEAASLPIAAVTAWYALTHVGKMQSGETLLIQGSGSVSLFALQMAQALGIQTIVLTGTETKRNKLEALGASHVINYRNEPNWEQLVLQHTKNAGVDMVLEVAGGNLDRSIATLKTNGTMALIGFLDNPMLTVNIFPVLGKQIRIQGIATGHREAFEEMNAFLNTHQIRPVIGKTYSFEQAKEALTSMGQGAFGKLVIKMTTATSQKQ